MIKSAILSDDRKHRYTLVREWDDGGDGYVMFIGLNPSTADETHDDPTIKRCIGFARRWGFSGLIMCNLFAYRATKPGEMRAADDPIGLHNDEHIMQCAAKARFIVACWGTEGGFQEQDKCVKDMLTGRLHVIQLTKQGHPAHPLYLPKNLDPQKWIYFDLSPPPQFGRFNCAGKYEMPKQI